MPQDACAARSQRQAQSNFPGTVRGARGKQTAEVRTRGQQNQSGENHQSGHKCFHRRAKIIAIKTWTLQGEGHVVVDFRIAFFEFRANRIQIGSRLFAGVTPAFRCPITEKTQRLPRSFSSFCPSTCSLIDDGHKEIGKEKYQRSVELRRCHAHNRKRIFIHLNNAAHYARIIVKMGVPIGVGEHDVRSAVCAMLV